MFKNVQGKKNNLTIDLCTPALKKYFRVSEMADFEAGGLNKIVATKTS